MGVLDSFIPELFHPFFGSPFALLVLSHFLYLRRSFFFVFGFVCASVLISIAVLPCTNVVGCRTIQVISQVHQSNAPAAFASGLWEMGTVRTACQSIPEYNTARESNRTATEFAPRFGLLSANGQRHVEIIINKAMETPLSDSCTRAMALPKR